MQRLKDKVAIITGAGAGIGKKIAEVFAQEGALTVVSSRRESNGQEVSDNIKKSGNKAIFLKCDVSVEDEVVSLVQKTMELYGRIDILINNAGVNFHMPFTKMSVEDWDRVIGTDLRGTFLCTYYCIPEMLKAGAGNIINISSVHASACLPGASVYDAAKWGIVGFTKSLAVEFADKNIRLNAISPGLIDTQIWDDIKSAAQDLDECLQYWGSNIPTGKVGKTEDIAYTAVFLASDEAAYITGANIIVDGGMTSQLISRANFRSRSLDGKNRL
jgi:NAD(P)-dependent dehydrogenase (short-subunit alcohol dehydrogenase family)